MTGSGTGITNIVVNGGKGSDGLHANAAGLDIAKDSKLAVELHGGLGAENIGFKYDGVLKGTLTMKLNGGAGAGTVVGNITTEAGSGGTLNAVEHGGKGNDDLTLNVYDLGKLGDLDAIIYGRPGKDNFTHTSNVKVVR